MPHSSGRTKEVYGDFGAVMAGFLRSDGWQKIRGKRWQRFEVFSLHPLFEFIQEVSAFAMHEVVTVPLT